MKRLAWWSWVASGAALLAGRLGWEPGVLVAVSLASAHAILLAALFGRRALLAIQLRIAFSVVALAGALIPFPALHWMQLAAMSGRLAFDYCSGGRVLMLLPWNRSEPISRQLLRSVFKRGPQSLDATGVFDGPATVEAPATHPEDRPRTVGG